MLEVNPTMNFTRELKEIRRRAVEIVTDETSPCLSESATYVIRAVRMKEFWIKMTSEEQTQWLRDRLGPDAMAKLQQASLLPQEDGLEPPPQPNKDS